MKTSSDYKIHEQLYQSLVASDAAGWGGASHASRMVAWDKDIKGLIAGGIFPVAPAKILELGSGAGDVSIKFAQRGYHSTGVEISETAVAWAQRKSRQLGVSTNFYQGSVCNLSRFQEASFQAVVDGNCLHCILGDDRELLLQEVCRVLESGGIFYVSTMMNDPKSLEPGLKFDPLTRFQLKGGQPYRYMGLQQDLLQELVDFGFELIETKTASNSWWDHLSCLARKR